MPADIMVITSFLACASAGRPLPSARILPGGAPAYARRRAICRHPFRATMGRAQSNNSTVCSFAPVGGFLNGWQSCRPESPEIFGLPTPENAAQSASQVIQRQRLMDCIQLLDQRLSPLNARHEAGRPGSCRVPGSGRSWQSFPQRNTRPGEMSLCHREEWHSRHGGRRHEAGLRTPR